MIKTNLDLDQVKLLILNVIKMSEHQIGQGPASVTLIEHMAGETLEYLWEHTHQFAPLLYMSYKMQGDKTAVRGFHDPGGLVREIVVDPTVTAFTGEDPVEYAGIEFSRPGTKDGTSHDTFASAAGYFEDWFDEGFNKFSAEYGKSLGF